MEDSRTVTVKTQLHIFTTWSYSHCSCPYLFETTSDLDILPASHAKLERREADNQRGSLAVISHRLQRPLLTPPVQETNGTLFCTASQYNGLTWLMSMSLMSQTVNSPHRTISP
ncbi:hypothetical protein EYF80_030040 [Liparis tanakae]|uniref:Uncharacterized protein n=1 Tax=Liparis tanakae TaxID=230148 RepID=A0A4Z2H1L5_9TELE|nr:hypothetical protein EYF80_030040 [Liparis tanakae]